jgi:hypothetical protein
MYRLWCLGGTSVLTGVNICLKYTIGKNYKGHVFVKMIRIEESNMFYINLVLTIIWLYHNQITLKSKKKLYILLLVVDAAIISIIIYRIFTFPALVDDPQDKLILGKDSYP